MKNSKTRVMALAMSFIFASTSVFGMTVANAKQLSNGTYLSETLSLKEQESNTSNVMFMTMTDDRMPKPLNEIELIARPEKGEVEVVSSKSNNGMVNFNLKGSKDGIKYTVTLSDKDKEKYDVRPTEQTITIYEDREEYGSDDPTFYLKEKKKNNTDNTVVTPSKEIKDVTVKVNLNGKPLQNAKFTLFVKDMGIPNTVGRYTTDNNGEKVINSLRANSEYEIRISDDSHNYEKTSYWLTTGSNGEILTIDKKTVGDKAEVVFSSSKQVKSQKVDVYVMSSGANPKPVEGVEITANTISPKLKSYKTLKSDSNGLVSFNLESSEDGTMYVFNVSKMHQFKYDFNPSELTAIVKDEGVSFKDNAYPIIYVTPNHKEHILTDLKDKVKEAKKFLKDNKFKPNTDKDKLQKLIGIVEAELEKETTPTYASGFIKDLDREINALKPFVIKNNSNRGGTSSSRSSSTDKYEDNINISRIAGHNRYETSGSISTKAFEKADTLIVVDGRNFADALTASSLAGTESPIILYSALVENHADRLKTRNIIIVGGDLSVPSKVDSILKYPERGVENKTNSEAKSKDKDINESIPERKTRNVSRIAGENRYETAAEIADKVLSKKNNHKAIIADGRDFADALSIGSYAAKEGLPIILTDNGKIPESEMKVLKKYNINELLVVGGENSVPNSAVKGYEKVSRIAGHNRYETSRLIADNLFNNSKRICIADGREFADALSASYYAAKNNMPIILVNRNEKDKTKDLIKARGAEVEIIGGEKSVPSDLFR